MSVVMAADKKDCDYWPVGMVFVGLTDQGWQTYGVLQAGQPPQLLAIPSETRTPILSLAEKTVFYIDEAAQVSAFSLSDKQAITLLSPSIDASYAQPEIDENNHALYVVQLKQGKSVDTDIVKLNLATQQTTPVITQRSAQFESHLSAPWLYYSHVHCVLGCGHIIQEIWRYHTVSSQAEQVTLLNTISRQPAVDQDNQWLYFSSNVAGNYHIYRQSLTQHHAQPEPLTQGAVTDRSPAPYQDTLYFIRQQVGQVALMCRTQQGKLYSLPLPKGITQLRDLEV
ncbi:hypothetical protein AB835_04055 [Candidatus Endobugula sertula]|uniref:DUF5050 domain-containing protein n=1 Tax=Candidatus Endobugula sertula TaxID=62101 RepID=A0A1D2QRY2_9GAMM|nr:hypothetical protein AB835_04055 [Candidatus Endobugula sertula]